MFYAYKEDELWLPTVLATLLVTLLAAGFLWSSPRRDLIAPIVGAATGSLVGAVLAYAIDGNPFDPWLLILGPIYLMDAALFASGTALLLWLLLRRMGDRGR